MTKDDITIEEIMYNLFMAGLGSAGMDDIEDADDRDRAIINMQKHYTTQAKAQLYELLSSVIGKDFNQWGELTTEEQGFEKVCNELRAEQRTKLTHLFNPTESEE